MNWQGRVPVLVALWSAVAMAGCAPAEGNRYTRIEQVGLDEAHHIAFLDEAITVEIRFFDQAGAPAEPGWFQWLGALNPLLPSDPSTNDVTLEESFGVRRATIVPHVGGPLLLNAIARPCPSCEETAIGTASFWVTGHATEVHPLNESPSSMVVGERRPFAGLPVAVFRRHGITTERPIRTPDPVVVSVDDPAVATADEHGVVTALAQGQTVVRLTAAQGAAEVVLNVLPGTVAAPSNGIHPILGVRQVSNQAGLASTGQKTDHHLVVDERNWPTLVAEARLNVELSPAVVISWTGSGFGAELVGEFQEQPSDTSIAIDRRGRLYVCYTSGTPGVPRVVVAERPSDSHYSEWTYRDLPRRPVMWDGQEVEPWKDTEPDRDLPTGPFAFLQRPDQGVFVAYRTVGTNPLGTNELDSQAESLRLAEVTDEAILAEDVQTLYMSWDDRLIHDLAALDIYVIPPTAEGQPPRVVVQRRAEETLYEHAVLFQKLNGAWGEPVQVLPEAGPNAVDLPTYELSSISPVLPLPEVGDPEWVVGRGRPASDMYAFAGNGSMWEGRGTLSPLWRRAPYGAQSYDDAAPLVTVPDFPPDDSFVGIRNWPVVGMAWTEGRMHWVAEESQANLVYVTAQPVRPALTTDSEELGTRITDLPQPPVPTGPVASLPDGSRMVTLATYQLPPEFTQYDDMGTNLLTTTVLRSEGPDQPWSALPSDNTKVLLHEQWFDVEGEILGLNQSLGGVLEVVRLLPDLSLQTVLATMVSANPVSAQMVGRRLFVLLGSDVGYASLLYSPAPMEAQPFSNLLEGLDTVPLTVDPRDLALLKDGQEVLLISRESSTDLGHLRLNAFDADGQFVETHDCHIPDAAGNDSVRTAMVTSDGTIYLWGIGTQGVPRLLRSKDRLASVEIAASWETPWLPPPAPIQLPDGRLAISGSWHTAPDIIKSFVMTSVDGTTWSEPLPLRPDGGNGQRVMGLTAEGDHVLALLLDNGAMRAYWMNASLDLSDYAANVTPWMDPVVVRVAP